jgi:cyanophycinase-like exopeptidase
MMAKKAPNPIDKHVGSRVRMRRMMLSMSQEKLGDALGLTFQQVTDLLHGLARRGRVAGFDIVELVPARDLNGVSALTAGRLVLNLIGSTVRSGRLGRRGR